MLIGQSYSSMSNPNSESIATMKRARQIAKSASSNHTLSSHFRSAGFNATIT